MENEIEEVCTISHTITSSRKGIEGFNDKNIMVPIKSRLLGHKKSNLVKKLLVVSNIINVILLIAFIVALYNYVQNDDELKKLKQNSICTSEECLRSATNLKLSMDLTVDPCEDFYKFTCGRWTKEHLNHGWFPHYSNFEIATERIAVLAINFFESTIAPNEPLPARQSQDLYLSCMDTKTLNSLGVSVLVKYLKRVDLPVIPTYFNDNKDPNFKFDWIKAEVDLKKTFAIDTFIGLSIRSDFFDRYKDNAIYMTIPDGDSPLPTPLKYQTLKSLQGDDEALNIMETAWKNIVKGVIEIIAQNQTIAILDDDVLLEDAATVIWNITRDVAALSAELKAKSFSIDFLRLTVDNLQNVTNQYLTNNNESVEIIWERYLTLLFEGVQNVTLDLNIRDLVYIHAEELVYFCEVALYLAKVTDLHMELYMWWTAVKVMMASSTAEIKNLITRESEPLVAIEVHQPRSIECATIVIQSMGLAVSYGIVDKSFRNNTEPKVEQMLNNIKDAFAERVTTINWMDDKTKWLTRQKTIEMISFIGFPEWLMDKEKLEDYYDGIVDIKNDTFLDNMITIIEKGTTKLLDSLRMASERGWVADPTTVNAFNYFADNSITVPMAILTFPFYNLGLEVLNYGAIGSILGHEVTHGFDDMGRSFGKFGNYEEWWTDKTRIAYENKSKCFVNQYGNFSIQDIDEKVDGIRTLSENLADNEGLNHAFLAYQHYLTEHGSESKLPGFENFSNVQMFFVAYSSVRCETTNVDSLKHQIVTDEYSPSLIRVLGTLQNLQEFSDAFECPVGSKMNPERSRCRIW